MKIVNCALFYADGDKYVWSVVTEGASEFPIDKELVADGSIWENDGAKSVLTDGSWVAESSGGGASFADVTFISSSNGYNVKNLITEDDEGFPEIRDAFEVLPDKPITVRILLGSSGKAGVGGNNVEGFDSSVTPIVTGDVAFRSWGFEISGNGTITLKGLNT